MLFKKTCLSAAISSLALFSATAINAGEEDTFGSNVMDLGNAYAVTAKEMCHYNAPPSLIQGKSTCAAYGSRSVDLFLTDANQSTWFSRVLTPDRIEEAPRSAYFVGYMSYRDAKRFNGNVNPYSPTPIHNTRNSFTKDDVDQLPDAILELRAEKPALATVDVTFVNMPYFDDYRASCGDGRRLYLSSERSVRGELPDGQIEHFSSEFKAVDTSAACSTVATILNSDYYAKHDENNAYNSINFSVGGIDVSFGPDTTPYSHVKINTVM